nr:hypothetical protein [uncultured Arsenicibacter sp.]
MMQQPVNMNDVIEVTFHVMQNGKPVAKLVKIKRGVFIDYNAKPKSNWAELYEMIVRDKVYESIADLGRNN